MQVNNGIGLRETLEQLDTVRLDELLRLELEKETPDPDVVRLMMSILEQRDKATPKEMTPRDVEAWERYQQRMAGLEKKQICLRPWFTTAASLLVILGLLFTVMPQQAEADTFWQMLQRWSAGVMEIFGKQDVFQEPEYAFKTNNDGLQQIYDAVVEMGISESIVPMWLPEQYELVEFTHLKTPALQSVHSRFSHTGNDIVYKVEIYTDKTAHQFYKDDTPYDSYERNGTTYNITKNTDWWVVIWTKDNIECFLTLDCQEDTLRRILESIYVTED